MKTINFLITVISALLLGNYCFSNNLNSKLGSVLIGGSFSNTETIVDFNSSQSKKNKPASKNFSERYARIKLAPNPPMGWNSWNYFGKKHINEKVVHDIIDAIVKEGLGDVGYNYVVIDGGWRDTILNLDGSLRPNLIRFPHGIKALAEYAHRKGLKFGLHTVPGTADCGGDRVGGYNNELVQIRQFIEWGVDFIKLDKCQMAGGWNELLLEQIYTKWKHLIDSLGSKIVLSISAYKFRNWNPRIGQMSRTTGDIGARSNGGAHFDTSIGRKLFYSNTVMEIAELNNQVADYAGNGYWNDPDMLPLGAQGLSTSEQKSTFALWCIMSSPLMLGNDPRYMSPSEKDIILNRAAIRINQDPTEQGRRLIKKGYCEIWGKYLNDGKLAVLMLNRNQYSSEQIDIGFKELRLNDKVMIKDVFRDVSLGYFEHHFNREIEPNSSMFLLIENFGENSK